MLPRSFSKVVVNNGKTPSFKELKSATDNEDNAEKDYDYFNTETGILLEDEEDYDVYNSETFGESLPDALPDEMQDMGVPPSWEEYDLHNDETFGEENIEYDWEAENEKMVSILETDAETEKICKGTKITDSLNEQSKDSTPNGYLGVDYLNDGFPLVDLPDDRYAPEENTFASATKRNNQFFGLSERADEDFIINQTSSNDVATRDDETFHNTFGCTSQIERLKNDPLDYTQGYSLFASGTSLLQKAGIHIPPVTSANSSPGKSLDNLDKKMDAMKLQSTVNAIPSVSDLEKQWINDAASKPVITADCFRAYNSAFFVNNTFVNNNTSPSSFVPSPVKSSLETFNSVTEKFRNEPNQVVMQLQKMVYTSMPAPGSDVRNDNEFGPKRNLNGSMFQPKPYPLQMMPDSGMLMYNNVHYQTPTTFTDVNGGGSLNTFAANNAIRLNRGNASMLMESAMSGSNLAGVGMAVFPPPPPGLTIDPSKIVRMPPNAAALPSASQLSSHLTLPPPQALNGIITVEQQKQLMKMQKEGNISNVDEYAGLMTEREKYWLSGVQLLQINSMDPYKDDYYFTNYQARRKGNRNKNQNQNNATWKNQQTKDYSPLQFENSLGRVQLGSVVAPRKVIDTYLIESSPKHTGKASHMLHEDPIANTSSRKRKAIMLHIENMYSKIMALENLQVNGSKSKADPAAIKTEFMNIANALREEILNLKDDFKIIMSIKKGKRLILKFLTFCDDAGDLWFQIFEILDRIVRGDYEHCILLSYLPFFRAWLSGSDLATLIRLADSFKQNLNTFLQDKFSVSAIANMIEHAEIIYYNAKPEEQKTWMDFVTCVAAIAHLSVDNVQKPVVSVKPQVLRSHLLKCKKLENGYMSHLLKIFSNNLRK